MTTSIPTQCSDDPLAPFALPDILRPDGPLETRVRSFDKSQGDWQHERLKESILKWLEWMRSLFTTIMNTPGMTMDQALYKVFLNCKSGDQLELFSYSILEHSIPDRFPNVISNPVLRLFDKNRGLLDAVLGEFVSKRLANTATSVVQLDLYHAHPSLGIPDFSKVNDCEAYQQVRQQKLRSPKVALAISTGIFPLDEATQGLNGLCMIGGLAGGGKSALTQQFGLQTLKACPTTALIFHQFDMSKDQCFDRLVCALGGVTERDLHDPTLPPDRQAMVNDGIEQLRVLSSRIDIVRHPAGQQLDVYSLIERRNAFLKSRNCSRALLIFDYFQLICVGEDMKDSIEADKKRMEIVQTLQKSQLHGGRSADNALVISEVRKTDGGGPLGLSDLLGSSRIGYAADTVLMLQQTGKEVSSDAETAPLDLRVVKTRGGRKTTIPLMFDFLKYRFRAAEVEVASGRSKATKTNGTAQSKARSPLG